MCGNMNGTFLCVCADNSHYPSSCHIGMAFELFCGSQNPWKHEKCSTDGFDHHSGCIHCCSVSHMGHTVGPGNRCELTLHRALGYFWVHTPHMHRRVYIPHSVNVQTHTYVYAYVRTYVGPTFHAGTRVRVAASGMLFKHSINLHLQTVASISVGKIMSLLSSDVHRFDQVRMCICMLVKSHNSIPQCHSVKIRLWCSEKSTFNNVEYSAFKMLCAWEPSGRSKTPQQCDCLGGMACIYALRH